MRVVTERVLGAVAVMHVEVDDGNTLKPVRQLRVARGDGDVVENAKTHGPLPHGMVPGGAHRTESAVVATAGHQVDRQHPGAGGRDADYGVVKDSSRSDVNAAGWLVEHERPGLMRRVRRRVERMPRSVEGARHHDLLLVAAAELAREPRRRARLDGEDGETALLDERFIRESEVPHHEVVAYGGV